MAGPRIILDEELVRKIVSYWRKEGYEGIVASVQERDDSMFGMLLKNRRIVSNLDGRGFPPKQ